MHGHLHITYKVHFQCIRIGTILYQYIYKYMKGMYMNVIGRKLWPHAQSCKVRRTISRGRPSSNIWASERRAARVEQGSCVPGIFVTRHKTFRARNSLSSCGMRSTVGWPMQHILMNDRKTKTYHMWIEMLWNRVQMLWKYFAQSNCSIFREKLEENTNNKRH